MGLTAAELEAVIAVDDSMFDKGLDAMLSKFEGWGGKAKGLMAGIGVLGGGLFAQGFSGGMDMSKIEGRLQAQLGLTEKESARLGGVAGKVYADNYGASLDEVGDAVGTVVASIKGMRQASDSEVEAMTKKALSFSQVFGIDVARAVNVAGVAMKNGLAKSGGEAFDELTATLQKVSPELREPVLDATEEYAQFFSQLGISGPKAFGLIAQAADKGQFGIDKVGDAIKEFTIRASDLGDSGAQAALKSLGLNAHETASQILQGGKTAKQATQKIVSSLLSVKDPAKQANAAISLFGTPLEDLGKGGIPKFLSTLAGAGGELKNFAGATDAAGTALNDNAGANLDKFTRGLQAGFVAVVGGTVIPMVNQLTGVIGGLGSFLSDHQVVAVAVLGAIGLAFAAWGAAALLAAGQNVVAWGMAVASAAAGGAATELSAAQVAAKWILMGVTSTANAAIMAAAWLASIWPIALVIAAVVGLVAVIVTHWDQVKAITGAVWDWVSSKVTEAWHAVTGAVSTGVDAVVGFVTTLPGKTMSALSSIPSRLRGLFSDAWHGGLEVTASVGGNVVDWVRGLPGKAAGALGSLGSKVSGIFSDTWHGALDVTRNLAGEVVSWIESIPGKIAALGGRFGSAGRALLQDFIDGMRNAAGIIAGIAGNVWDAVRGLLNGAIARINAALSFTIGLPFGKSITIDPPDIPMLATGGRATAATLAVIGEGREPESVLPDSVLASLLTRARSAGVASAQVPDVDVDLDAVIAELRALGDRLAAAMIEAERYRAQRRRVA